MAQKGSKRKVRNFSMDAIMLRYAGGLALIALSVFIFLAVDLGLQGYVFQGLRGICCGLCGGLARVLPALPLWAGILMIWSTQRRAPVRPLVYAGLAFVGICTFVVLVTRTSARQDYFTYLSASARNEWGDMIRAAYENCAARQHSGGALGALLAWPLWRYLGTFLGAVIVFLLTALCVLMALNLTPARLRDLFTGRAGQWKEQKEKARAEEEARQLQWQQEQARQQEMMRQQLMYQQQMQQQQMQQQQMQQQQMQQQQMQQQMQPSARQPVQPQPVWPQRQDPRPAGQDSQSSVEAWQDRYGTQQLQPAGGKSRIFDRKRKDPSAENREQRPSKSRLFQRREKDDGLVDGPAAFRPQQNTDSGEDMKPAEAGRPESGRRPVRPEPAGEIGRPETASAYRRPGPELRLEDPEPVQIPDPVRTAQPVRTVQPVRTAQPAGTAQPARTAQPAGTAQPVRPPVSVKPEERRPEEKPEEKRPQAPEPERDETPAVAVPKVQQKIRTDAYKPDLVLPPKAENEAEEVGWQPVPYNYPLITNLKRPEVSRENTSEEDAMRSRRLEETLASFKVQARVINVTHGPAISRFELELAAGTKVSKVAELEKDIAYGMEATSVRIEAPIPGKSLVGVEVPNRKVAKVTLREVLESDRMQQASSVLTVALGKDIAGTPIVCDLAKMPHMLIAGQTGSGKSVCINAIINSLLFRASPDEVRLILVDPKVVELQCYNNIPHLLIPVVNDPRKAAAALAWAVAEMMERYDRFAERKVRNLDGYNQTLEPGQQPMARIVIIIDELADLMMVCKKDVEEYICRLTQLARAAGIHLIVATQRPSVDVITGLIKANIPSRIAFKTASYVDSRTILDRNGSEQLLGWGDMLYLPTGSFAPTRVQGCFLSDEEVNSVVSDVRRNNPSTYDQNILDKLDELSSGSAAETGTGADMIGGPGDMGGDHSLFEQAVELAINDGQISTSTLQRRLKIGYARAGRLTDEMEERGIVAAKDGSKPRKCLITREEWEEIKKSTEGMS